jgi:hypothetical protein
MTSAPALPSTETPVDTALVSTLVKFETAVNRCRLVHHREVDRGRRAKRQRQCWPRRRSNFSANTRWHRFLPASTISPPPPPRTISLPEPVVMVLASREPVTVTAVVTRLASRLEIAMSRCRRRLVETRRNREIDARPYCPGQHQRIVADATVDRQFAAMNKYGVVAATAMISAASTVDGIAASTTGTGWPRPIGDRRARRQPEASTFWRQPVVPMV